MNLYDIAFLLELGLKFRPAFVQLMPPAAEGELCFFSVPDVDDFDFDFVADFGFGAGLD